MITALFRTIQLFSLSSSARDRGPHDQGDDHGRQQRVRCGPHLGR